MRFNVLAAATLLLWSAPAMAQRTVTGTVIDAVSAVPLEGVSVSVRGTTTTVNTAAGGRFTLNSAPVAPFTIVVRRIGYQPMTVNVPAGLDAVRVILTRDLL